MAGSERTIIRNSVFIAVGTILGNVFSMLFRVIVARYYGPADFGIFSVGFMFTSIATTLCVFGLSSGLVKHVSEFRTNDEQDRNFGVIGISFTFSLLLSIIATSGLFIITPQLVSKFFQGRTNATFVQWFVLQIPANVIITLVAAVAIGYEFGGVRILIKELIPKFLIIAFSLLVIAIGGSLTDLGIGYVIAQLVAGIISIIYLYYILYQDNSRLNLPNGYKKDIKSLFRYSAPLFLSNVSIIALNWIDTAVVAYYLTEVDVGIYQTAFILGSSLSLFFGAISSSLFPNFSALLTKGDTSKVLNRYQQSTHWSLIVTSAPFFYLITYPTVSIEMLFGSKFTLAALPLVVILIGQYISISLGPSLALLKSAGSTRFISFVFILAIGLNLLGNVLLVPHHGIIGAAVTTGAVSALQGILFYVKSKQVVPITILSRNTCIVLASGTGCSILMYYLYPQIAGWIQFSFSITVFSTIYMAVTLYFIDDGVGDLIKSIL